MKYLLPIILLLSLPFLAEAQSYKKKYKDLLESKSKLVVSGYNFTVEEVNKDKYVIKRYYPENRQIIFLTSFNSNKFDTKHGPYGEWYDDGTLVMKGIYADNKKEGHWIENRFEKGFYKNDLREDKWVTADKDGNISTEKYYTNGELNGKYISYDSLGNIVAELDYDMGELLNPEKDTVYKGVESMPRFLGCEDLEGTDEEKHKCATQKLLKYVYSNIRYPQKARNQGASGKALIRFVINKEGDLTDIKVLRGVTKEIKAECIRFLEKMPKWRPGEKDGKPVKVQYNLPINFKLE